MKKQLIVATAVLVSAMAFGQKKEIKKAEKAFAKGDLITALEEINAAESMISSADDDLKAQFYAVKGEVLLADAKGDKFEKLKLAADSFIKAKELDKGNDLESSISSGIEKTRVALFNSAVKDQNADNFSSAAEKFALSYEVQNDTIDLYYAAVNYANAKEDVKAVSSLRKLLDMNFTGIKKEYRALRISDNEVVNFASESDRNTEMITGKYTQPTEGKSESLKGDILRTIVLIESNNGNKEGALALIKEARAERPNDVSLMRTEASIAYEMGDAEKANSLMKEILTLDSSNPQQFFNAGVMSAKAGDIVNAKKYYSEAIKLDPENVPSMINMSILILAPEKEIVDEMNSLGMSKADTKRYDELTLKREGIYKEALPYLINSSKARPENVDLMNALMNAYSQLGMDAESKALKAKISQIEGN